MPKLSGVLLRAANQLPDEKRAELRPLLATELIDEFSRRLELIQSAGGTGDRPGPRFDEENTPAISDAFRSFIEPMTLWSQEPETAGDAVVDLFQRALADTDIVFLLVLLGQRTTPGSVVDHRAFPPARSTLLDAAAAPDNETGQLTTSGRAITKHAARENDPFWEQVTGSEQDRNAAGERTVTKILEDVTWWNVFAHDQHGLVYEARIDSGHGARWSSDGRVFIGFVDPFDAAKRIEESDNRESDEAKSPAIELPEVDLGPLPERLDRDELQRRYVAGQRQFLGANLSGADLTGLDLKGIDLTGGNLTRTKLYRTNFEGAKLIECDLNGTYLAGTNFNGVNARRANLRGCRIDKVHWRNVDLEGARLDQANLREAELVSCSFRRTGLAEADLTNARLEDVRAYGTFLEGACWQGASLRNCRFNNGRLSKADFTDARFERCNFEGADIAQTSCVGARFENCEFTDADFSAADLSKCTLTGALLDRARLSGTRLTGAKLSGASLAKAEMTRANLSGADLSQSTLAQADLSRADLRAANLKGATLHGADLSAADVVDTQVDEMTTFEATKTIGVDFGTNWSLRQRVMDSAHDLTIRHFRKQHPVLGFFWWAMLGCGKRNWLLLVWGVAIVMVFAGLMAVRPGSFDFGQQPPSFFAHCQNSLAVFVTLDLAVDKGTDSYGRSVMLIQMLLSYLMLGFMASLFSGIFPNSPD